MQHKVFFLFPYFVWVFNDPTCLTEIFFLTADNNMDYHLMFGYLVSLYLLFSPIGLLVNYVLAWLFI